MVSRGTKCPLWGSKERFGTRNRYMKKIFNYGINTSRIHQGFYRSGGDNSPVNVAPNCAIEISELPRLNVIQPIPSVIKYFKGKGITRFYMRRTFAMGDVLMLVPIVRYLRTLGFDPYIKTRDKYIGILELFGIETRPLGFGPDGAGIELDRTVELDHSHPEMQKLHRINIYLTALGFDKFPEKLEWGYDKKKFPAFEELKDFKFKKKDYMIFQGSGSTRAKSLSKERIEDIINALNRKGRKVVYIGNSVRLNLEKPEMVQMACVRYNFLQLFSMFENARAALIMDSGPLWLSHFTRTPIVVIFGPTDPSTRLTYHPLYPKKVRAVETNKHINCKRCYEAAARCEHKFKCLHIPFDTLFNDLYPKLREI